MKNINDQPDVYCMNRGWKFIEKDFSVLTSTKKHNDIYAFAKGGAAKGPAEAGFDDSMWQSVELPHDWVTGKDFTEQGIPNQGYKERGCGWYRMKFALEQNDRDKQILLEFEGMSADAQIYVNGMLLKRSYSGYNSFSVDMTDMANFGEAPNVIAIRIDASAWQGWWYEGAGIYRNVWLCKKSAVHLAYQGIWLNPIQLEEGRWRLCIEANVENSFADNEKFEVEHVLADKDGNTVGISTAKSQVDGFGNSCVRTEVEVRDPDLWDPDCPRLYQVRSSVKIAGKEADYQTHRMGFRTIRLDAGTGFWLNGKKVKLKGFCNHQDHAGVGVAVPYKVKEYRVRKLKELGANAYRCAHNPDPEILDICDRMGMMVMEENRTFSSAGDNLEEVNGIVKNARNHPSVILYSVLNEEPLQGTGKGSRIAARLRAAIRELDNTRPVTGAFNGGYLEDEGAAAILDAVGINYNPMRYDAFHAKFPDTPLIGSETASAFMVRGEYQTDDKRHVIDDYDSECAIWGNTARDAWKQVNLREFVAGAFVWTGFDYRGEPTPFEWPSVATYFGTYDSCGFEKNACYLYRAFWKKEPMVHLVSPWSSGQQVGTPVRVQVYSNCDEVEVFVNGESVGRKTSDPYEQTSYEIAYQKGNIEVVGYQGDEAVAVDFQRTAEKVDRLILETVFPYLEDNGHDAAIVNTCLVDQKGTVLPNAEEMVYFEVQHGKVLGVGNGNPISHEPDSASYRRLYHGKAQLILKANSGRPVVIKARTESGFETELLIPVEHVENIPYVEPVNKTVIDGWKLYYQLFDEMPDPAIQTDANDMNSFEPVAFTGRPQPELSGKLGKYALYRTRFESGKACIGRKLSFQSILGQVYLYLDGKELTRRVDCCAGGVTTFIDETLEGEHELTVIVKNENREYPEAGILSAVCLIQEK